MSKWIVYDGNLSVPFATRKAAESAAYKVAQKRAAGRTITENRTRNSTVYKAGSSVLSRCELSEKEGTRRDTRGNKSAWWR